MRIRLGFEGVCTTEVKEVEMSIMTVYHGGYRPVESPKINKGRFAKDFGEGFYCTTIKEQAERWARRNATPVVSRYEVRIAEGLGILDFKTMTDEWLDFIVACRRGIAHSHDIVVGAMANDQIYNYIGDFIDGSLTRGQFWVLMKFKYPTHQVAFCSPKALLCLKFVGSEVVNV